MTTSNAKSDEPVIEYATLHDPSDIPPDEKVPFKEKLAYGAGGIGGAIQGNADNALYQPIFVLGMGISPTIMSVRGAIEGVCGALFDATMGWATDATKSRWGRRKPWILGGGITASLWLPTVFFFNRSWSEPIIYVWLAVYAVMTILLTSAWNIPYQCMLLEITPNSRERTNVAAWRGYIGFVAWTGMSWVWWLTQQSWFYDSTGKPDLIVGARWVVSGFALVALVLSLLPLFVKCRVAVSAHEKQTMSFLENLKLTMTNKPFVILVFFTLLFTLGFQVCGGLDLYTRLFYVCKGDQLLASKLGGLMGTFGPLVGIAGIPVFQFIAHHKGKRFALAMVMAVVLTSYVSTSFCFNPNLPYLSMVPNLLWSSANGALWILIPSMTGDVVDYDQLQTGYRREGSFAATYSWTFKASITVAQLFSGPIVVWAGFNQKLAQQPEDVLLTMRTLLVVVPTLFLGSAIWLTMRYPLTTQRIAEIHDTLKARAKESGQASAG